MNLELDEAARELNIVVDWDQHVHHWRPQDGDGKYTTHVACVCGAESRFDFEQKEWVDGR